MTENNLPRIPKDLTALAYMIPFPRGGFIGCRGIWDYICLQLHDKNRDGGRGVATTRDEESPYERNRRGDSSIQLLLACTWKYRNETTTKNKQLGAVTG